MRFLYFFLVLGLTLSACNTTRKAVDVPAKNAEASAEGYPFIQKFHEGTRYKLKGQFAEAIAAFQECLALRPNDDAAAFALAQCYLATNQRTQAVTYTEIAAKADPQNIWYTQELAYMYYETQQLDKAEKSFEKMIAEQPQNIDWLFGYAEVLRRQGKNQQAVAAFNKMEDQLGVLPDLSLQKYDLYMTLKQDDNALAELEKARIVYPDDPSILGALVDHYFQKRDIEKAKNMLVELVKANPANGRAHLALGDLYMREGNKTEAYKSFKAAFEGEGVDVDTKMKVLLTFYEEQPELDQEVIELGEILVKKHGDDAKSHSMYGDLLLKEKREEEALASYKKALAIDESKYPIWNQILLLEYRKGLFEDLYKDARACSALFPTITNVQLLYTIAAVQTGRFQEAIDAADAGLGIVVNDKITEAEFYAQKGEADFKLNNIGGGTANFDMAIKLDPLNHLTKNNYAMMLAIANHDLPKANRLIDEVMTQYPNEAPFADTKGFILFQEGNFKSAKTQFEIANELAPDVAAYTEHLGDALVKSGETAKALELWKKAKEQGSRNKSLEKKIQTKSYHAPVY